MRRIFLTSIALILIATSACSDAEQVPTEQVPALAPVVIGKLEDPNIREASGLARSQQQDNVFWVINDNGAKEWVHAINPRGKRIGEFDLKKSDNVDWEDLASFSIDGKPYLLVADIGDNDARRKITHTVRRRGTGRCQKGKSQGRLASRFQVPRRAARRRIGRG